MGVGWRLHLGQHPTGVIHHADRYLCSTNINGANHDFPFASSRFVPQFPKGWAPQTQRKTWRLGRYRESGPGQWVCMVGSGSARGNRNGMTNGETFDIDKHFFEQEPHDLLALANV